MSEIEELEEIVGTLEKMRQVHLISSRQGDRKGRDREDRIAGMLSDAINNLRPVMGEIRRG